MSATIYTYQRYTSRLCFYINLDFLQFHFISAKLYISQIYLQCDAIRSEQLETDTFFKPITYETHVLNMFLPNNNLC